MRKLRSPWLVKLITPLMSLSLVWLEMCPSYATAARMNREEDARRPVIQVPDVVKGMTSVSAPPRPDKPDATPGVRILSTAQMSRICGRGQFRNPYFAGVLPWQKSYHDVNMCTGNLFKSFTDFQVSPARGAGLVMQRTYNSSDARVGPFGVGWTHAYDIRIQEAADVAAQDANPSVDTNVNDVPRTDFFGAKHTYHRDADGLYSPPPYMHDELSSDYGKFLVNGPQQVMDDTQTGMDGSVKHFVNIVTKSDGSSGNERACDYIEDRHGNRTNLAYGLTYTQPDGSTRKLLTSVTDPSGRSLAFTWTNLGTTSQPAYRITQVQGPLNQGAPVVGVTYTVAYAYFTDTNDPNAANNLYNLKSVTIDPKGLNRATAFTYASCTDTISGQTEYSLLASIQQLGVDSVALGHKVSYGYGISTSPFSTPYGTSCSGYASTGTVWVTQITEPGGVDSSNNPRSLVQTINPFDTNHAGYPGYQENYIAQNDPVNGVAYLQVWVDTQLRTTAISPQFLDLSNTVGGSSASPWYGYNYDTSNNVVQKSSAGIGPGSNGYQEDDFTYGTVGNVLTHRVVNDVTGRVAPGGQVNGYYAGQETFTYYDASKYFQKATSTDMNGHTSVIDYYDSHDANPGNRGEVKYVRDARYATTGAQATFIYDSYGHLLTNTNFNGIVTQNTYGDGTNGDAWGNLIKTVQDPGAGHLVRTNQMVYDVAGHIIQSTDPNGRVSNFQYNVTGQPATVTTPSTAAAPAETISYVYDGGGRTQSVTDNRGLTLMSYEPGCDRIHSVTNPVTGTTTYGYRVTGDRSSLVLPSGRTYTYAYAAPQQASVPALVLPSDDLDKAMRRLTSIADDQGRKAEFLMDSSGHLLQSKTDEVFGANGSLLAYLQSDYAYDNSPLSDGTGRTCTRSWLSSLKTTWHSVSGSLNTSRLISENDYTYDNSGLRQTNQITMPVTNADGSPQYTGGTPQYDGNGNVTNEITSTRSEAYGYDELNRLTSVNYGDGETQSYQFDPMGNRLTKGDTVGGTTTTTNYGYDAANRLTTLNGNTTAYTNDADGNTLTGGGRTLTWDSQNRMVQSVMGGVTSTYTYASDGLRRSTTTSGVTTNYGYDSSMMVGEYQKNAQNQLVATATYFQGLSGPACRIDETYRDEGYYNPTGTAPTGLQVRGRSRWYIYDGHNSVVGEVDYNGNLTGTKHFDVYGSTRTVTGVGTTKQGYVGSLGHQTDTETGLIYMQARYYDPTIGRFASEDPSQDGNNWFRYCGDDPVNCSDPTGRFAKVSDEQTVYWLAANALALAVMIACFVYARGDKGLFGPGAGALWGIYAVMAVYLYARAFGKTPEEASVDASAGFIGELTIGVIMGEKEGDKVMLAGGGAIASTALIAAGMYSFMVIANL